MADQPPAKAPAAEASAAAETSASAAAETSTAAAVPEAAATDPPAVPHWTQADYEDELDDGDSALGSDNNSSTASISASIMEYRTVHGRRFHAHQADDDYWSPNDDRQKECMDITHQVMTMLHGDKLYIAPISEKVEQVLDIGTGTGIWAIDFADLHPEAQVIGTDVTPIQPSWVPPNLRFEIDDFTLPWTFKENHFDYVHMRYIFGAVADWKELCAQAFRVTKPGGWIESCETSVDIVSDDSSIVPGMALWDWGSLFQGAGRKLGKSMAVLEGEDGLVLPAIKEAGFVDVEIKTFKLPVTGWPKDEQQRKIGIYNHFATEEGLEGYALYLLTAVHGWAPEQVQLYLSRVRKELRSKRVHPYYKIQTIVARKPEAS